MKLDYYPDTDSLYIDFSSRPSVESQGVSPGVSCWTMTRRGRSSVSTSTMPVES
jgi:hypothetical protein